MTEPNSTLTTENTTAAETLPSNQPAEWTIMVYMAGDNNLADDCVNALKKLQEVKTGNTVHVVAQFDPSDVRLSTQRLVLNLRDKPGIRPRPLAVAASPSTLAQDNVKVEEGLIKFKPPNRSQPQTPLEEGESDTADPKTLFDFISWTQQYFKAKRYMLVLAGHAGGIEENYLLRDENPSHAMTLAGLKDVLGQAGSGLHIKLDILAMDSCLMSMVEICYEFKDLGLIDVFVSSQSTTPNPGWPYGEIVETLMESEAKLSGEEFAKIIVNKYVNSYIENAVNSGLATDLSALKVNASAGVAENVKKLAAVLKGKLGPGSGAEFNRALVHAHWEAQSYNGELFVDLFDLCELLAKYCNDSDVTAAAANVKESISKMVLAACFCGIDYQYSNGISIYFPWSKIFAYYQNLAFAKEDGADWFSFLAAYVEATRREPRGGDAPGPVEKFLFVRKVPPYGHGPSTLANSMRNPPRKWSKNGIKHCIEHHEEWARFFETFR